MHACEYVHGDRLSVKPLLLLFLLSGAGAVAAWFTQRGQVTKYHGIIVYGPGAYYLCSDLLDLHMAPWGSTRD